MKIPFKITKEQQVSELVKRIPPVLNVDLVVINDKLEYLIGKKIFPEKYGEQFQWIFPGGRMRWNETIEDTINRKLFEELPGVKANLKKLITALCDRGFDHRANGVTLYYLLEYVSGKPQPNEQLIDFKWVSKDEFLKLPRAFWLQKTIVNEIDTTVKYMNSNEDEILVEVDKKDREIGTIQKREAHSTNKRSHRSAMMLIFDSAGNVILQQRSWKKAHYPGYWDVHGGHQISGMTIDQTANQELVEELGIKTDLVPLCVNYYLDDLQSEFQHWYYGVSDGPYGYDKNEVEQIMSFDPEKLINGGYDKEYQILPHVIEMLQKHKKVWEKI